MNEMQIGSSKSVRAVGALRVYASFARGIDVYEGRRTYTTAYKGKHIEGDLRLPCTVQQQWLRCAIMRLHKRCNTHTYTDIEINTHACAQTQTRWVVDAGAPFPQELALLILLVDGSISGRRHRAYSNTHYSHSTLRSQHTPVVGL
jgi:hypothetical protein